MLYANTLARPQSLTRFAIILGFALFTGIAAQVQIPLPFTPVPITLQVLAVILAGLLLGPVDGFLAMLTYLGLIAVGAPFAAGWIGGPAAFVGPTAGYLLSFPLAAALVGWIAGNGDSRLRSFAGALAGIVLIYLCGAAWLASVLSLAPAQALQSGVAPFILVDLMKAIVAVVVARSGIALLQTLLPRAR